MAGLIYQVCWTRLLTLVLGHTTAAASAVVAAFLGGLALGAWGGGVLAARWSRRRSLVAYAMLEVGVAIAAVVLPYALQSLRPLLEWAYNDGGGQLFPVVRLLTCLALVLVPASALGATFPLAIRWFVRESVQRARSSSVLYTLNTTGAVIGALLAAFVLIPAIGVSGATKVGVGASALAAVCAVFVGGLRPDPSDFNRATPTVPRKRLREGGSLWIACAVLGLSGFAALVHEIVWTRILTLVLGPTIYAFAATLAAVIAGVAIGSAIGTWLVARATQHATWLSWALILAAITIGTTSRFAGQGLPAFVAQQLALSPDGFDLLLRQGMLLAAALIVPTAACLGAAFPLALAAIDHPSHSAVRRFGLVYAINTVGAVAGALAAGFLLVPLAGLQKTLMIVGATVILTALIVFAFSTVSRTMRVSGGMAAIIATVYVALSPPWDRELLASGVYMYAAFAPKDIDLETLLKAGTLLYYREGAGSTVSVKRLTGTKTLAVDGKTDASNRSDMLTQKLIAHLPLLVHENPRQVGIIGLGSGVTVAAALRHPIERADVIEISPEVVEASALFNEENGGALDDPRTNLIVGDGRSHLLLSSRKYDVIISEPSNPWIAGVAALFTQEFFLAARERLAPQGIICQWANAYNISDADLRAIVATFLSVFPHGTAWLIGGDDVLLMASSSPLDGRLGNIETNWKREGVNTDLGQVFAQEPFAVLSLFVAGAQDLARYADNASLLTDDRMTLEFSAPREIHRRDAGQNATALAALAGPDDGPQIVRQAMISAGAPQWRRRGDMMAKRDAHPTAYDDYLRALALDPRDVGALDGFVRIAILSRRSGDALKSMRTLTTAGSPTAPQLVAMSKLLASLGLTTEAIAAAHRAARIDPSAPAPIEQLASLFADGGDVHQLKNSVQALQRIAPNRAPTFYYTGVLAFLQGNTEDAVRLSRQAIAIDSQYAPVYDLMGAAYTKLGQALAAQDAFQTSLRLEPHDSTAYTNLGLLESAAGNHDAARRYFAEALWLEPVSVVARRGLVTR